jgi:ribosome biogenesis GTPase
LSAADNSVVGGLVVGTHGRQYLVELSGGETLNCYPRGKRSNVACGDRVDIRHTAAGQGVIESIGPRSSFLYRSDQYRQKLIAANVTQVVVVLAAVPSFYEELLNRCLIAAEDQRIEVLIVLNKYDMEAESVAARQRLTLFERLGYRVLAMSAKRDAAPLRPLLANHASVLVGQSGMGKSTIINALLPDARVETAEVSEALDSGRHTTTHAKLHRLDGASVLIDSPGLQEFGLHHLSEQEIAASFREFRPLLGNCRFHNCRHLVEPGCAIADAMRDGAIDAARLETYRRLAKEIEAGKRY